MEQCYDAYEPASWSLPEDFLERSHFERVLGELDLTSSPGYPYLRHATNNRQLFKVNDDNEWDAERIGWMWNLVQSRLKDRSSDPIRVFIKAEPHKIKKIEDHRYRLISSVSVADQIIDHMIFGDCNRALIDNWPFIPSKPGWSHLLGGWRMIPTQQWIAADKSGWDWTARLWLFELCLALRKMLCRTSGPLLDKWVDYAQWRYQELYTSPTFITSDGLLLKQKTPGVMKSGCVNTIADNSMMQVFLHLRTCYEIGIEPGTIYTMGDDTLQEPMGKPDLYRAKLGEFCRLKEFNRVNEFSGFRFQGRSVEPLYKGKHAFNLLHLDEDNFEQMADSYLLLYHRSRFRPWISNLLKDLGFKEKPYEWYDLIFDGH